jgi:hypothetical protein
MVCGLWCVLCVVFGCVCPCCERVIVVVVVVVVVVTAYGMLDKEVIEVRM